MRPARAVLRRLAGAVLGGLLGAVTGVLVVATHGRWWSLVLGAAAAVAVTWALPRGAARIGFGLGLAAVVVWLSLVRPEGDLAIAGDARGYAVQALVGVVMVLAVLTAAPPRRSGLTDHPSGAP